MGTEEAAALAQHLLDDHRADLGTAVGAWLRRGTELAGPLPARLDELPSQAGLDAWAAGATRGLVEHFPVTLTSETVLVLANALAVRERWAEPLGVGGDRLLVGEEGLLAVVESRSAGLVAVAVPAGRGTLDVLSVIAAPDVDPEDVWSAADEVTAWLLDGTLVRRRLPAVELDRAGHAWRVVRKQVVVPSGDDASELWTAALPSWTMESSTDLEEAPGVRAVSGAVLDLVRETPRWAACLQGATATYTAGGFQAAAVTAIAFMAGSATPPPTRKVRVVELTFDRPHAVVAVARGGAWDGVPLVHAWVDGATDPSLSEVSWDFPGSG